MKGILPMSGQQLPGHIAAKYLAPSRISAIGIIGTGIQARMQLSYLKEVTSCRKVVAWGRSNDRLSAYREDDGKGWV